MGGSLKNYTFIFFPEILRLEYPCLNSRRFENIAADVIIIVITSDVPEAFQSRQVIYSSHNITSDTIPYQRVDQNQSYKTVISKEIYVVPFVVVVTILDVSFQLLSLP